MMKCLTMTLQHQLDPNLNRLFIRSEKTAKDTLDTLKDLYQRLCIKGSIPRSPDHATDLDELSYSSGAESVLWKPSTNAGRARSRCDYTIRHLSHIPHRSASNPHPYSIGNASVESLSLDLECIRRRSSTMSLRCESGLVLQRNSAILSRRGL